MKTRLTTRQVQTIEELQELAEEVILERFIKNTCDSMQINYLEIDGLPQVQIKIFGNFNGGLPIIKVGIRKILCLKEVVEYLGATYSGFEFVYVAELLQKIKELEAYKTNKEWELHKIRTT